MLYSIVDIETTGGNYKQGKIIEIAIFVYDGENIIDSFCSLVNPEMAVPPYVTQLTGISNEMLVGEPTFAQIAKRVIEITTKTVIVAHNIQFDYGFLREELRRCGKKFQRNRLCTQKLSKRIFSGLGAYGLGKICQYLDIPMERQHRAVEDAKATTFLFEKMLQSEKSYYIERALNREDREHWPPQLPVEKVLALPEDAGLYYLKNNKGAIIFIGRSNDIQDRVFQHFSEFPESEWRKAMFHEVSDIDYNLTGSELVSMIIENYEVKKIQPLYNQKKRIVRYQWGVIHYKNEDGYICFKVNKVKQRNLALSYHRTESGAKDYLSNKMKEFALHPAFCQLQTKKNKINFSTDNQIPNNYNKRALQAMESFSYKNKDFLVVSDGRQTGELAAVLIKDEKFIGYDYFEEEMLTHPSEVAKLIKPLEPNFEVDLIIKSYIRNEHLIKILPIEL